jgi:hypothetical protein
LSIADSFFAKYARTENGELAPGRVYVGIHAPALGSLQTAQVRTFSALLQAAKDVEPEQRDPWWTLLVFFNSLRELGTTLSLIQSDIPDYLKVIRSRRHLTKDQVRYLNNVCELTGRLSSEDVPNAIAALEVECNVPKGSAVDVCLASNIIEVGIDIDRLSLMAVVGQPKNTAQYIQVTGRVGRKWWERPGVVAMIYGASKPRDRSHYEKFRTYHQRLYAQVEPTSVTPFAPPVLERALHAVMAAYARQLGPKTVAESPFPFPESLVDHLRELLQARVARVDPPEAETLLRVFRKRTAQWRKWERHSWSGSASESDMPLLREAGAYVPAVYQHISWPTPQSMRNVVAEAQLEITLHYFSTEEGDA